MVYAYLPAFHFFFNDTAPTEIYPLSLHDALPIYAVWNGLLRHRVHGYRRQRFRSGAVDRKSTRLNSSHANISYAVFCLKKRNDKICGRYLNIDAATHGIDAAGGGVS